MRLTASSALAKAFGHLEAVVNALRHAGTHMPRCLARLGRFSERS